MKKKNLFIISLIVSLFILSSTVFANEIPKVSIFKAWTITFNDNVSLQSLIGNVYIEDNRGGKVLFDLDYLDNNKRIVKIQPLLGYIPNSTYTLNLKKGIQSETGRFLKDDIKFQFATKSREESERN